MTRTRSSVSLIALAAGSACAAPTLNGPLVLSTAQRPAGIASADFNADGITDLAVAVDNIDRILVMPGNGDGTFGAPAQIFTGGGTGPDSLVAADIDGDGDADLGVVLKNTNTFRAYINTAGAFAPGADAATGAEPTSLSAADLDGDGDADFVTSNRDDNSISLILNNGAVFSSSAVAVGTEPRVAAAFGDRGQPLIVVSNHDDRTVSVLTGSGASYTITQTLSVGGAFRGEGVAAGDLDGDGDTDFAVAVDNAAALYFNSAGTFSGPTYVFTGGPEPSRITAGDLDGDGDTDLVTTNQDANSITVFENLGAGSFAGGVSTPVGLAPDRLLIADMDDNGSLDLAVSNRDSDTTWVFTTPATGPCTPADIDGDGDVDIDDIELFVAAFLAGAADLDNDGDSDIDDISAFVVSYLAGC